jgi:hypothetical protein
MKIINRRDVIFDEIPRNEIVVDDLIKLDRMLKMTLV